MMPNDRVLALKVGDISHLCLSEVSPYFALAPCALGARLFYSGNKISYHYLQNEIIFYNMSINNDSVYKSVGTLERGAAMER
ncbi:hypothetical protein YDYSG_61210 [Paenibacillus tyrfis]|nr:hypothetical protein YDYSG_61210 [Paenibacillus tyrfis]